MSTAAQLLGEVSHRNHTDRIAILFTEQRRSTFLGSLLDGFYFRRYIDEQADLLVDAGDHVQGGVIGTLSKGEYIVDIMNYLKYDAAVPGNHEFDYGMDQFLHIAKDLAKYPYISANFTGKDGTPYFDAYKIFEVKGVKFAFVGVCTP